MNYRLVKIYSPVDGYSFWPLVTGTHKASYFAGNNYVEAMHVLKILNADNRVNVEQREDGLYLCAGLHSKNEACDYVQYISYSKEDRELYKNSAELMRKDIKYPEGYEPSNCGCTPIELNPDSPSIHEDIEKVIAGLIEKKKAFRHINYEEPTLESFDSIQHSINHMFNSDTSAIFWKEIEDSKDKPGLHFSPITINYLKSLEKRITLLEKQMIWSK